MRYLILVAIVFVITFLIYLDQHPEMLNQTQPTPSVAVISVLGQQTKTTDCHVNGPYPDKACTPGDVFPNVTAEQVCQSGYSSSVRNVSAATKKQIYAAYGIVSHRPGEYEIDHFVPLELGGSNDTSNLFPEAAEPKPGFHEKDDVENYLHEQVCNRAMSLQEAQQKIATDWQAVYKQIPDPQKYNWAAN